MNPLYVDWAARHPVITFFIVWPALTGLMLGLTVAMPSARRTARILRELHRIDPNRNIYGGNPMGVLLAPVIAAIVCGGAAAVCFTKLITIQ